MQTAQFVVDGLKVKVPGDAVGAAVGGEELADSVGRTIASKLFRNILLVTQQCKLEPVQSTYHPTSVCTADTPARLASFGVVVALVCSWLALVGASIHGGCQSNSGDGGDDESVELHVERWVFAVT